MTDNCDACNALRDECGEHFETYAKRLLQRGWAGQMSPVERAYYRKHRSVAQQGAAEASAARARVRGFGKVLGRHAIAASADVSEVDGAAVGLK